MATLLETASLVMVPSGYEEGTLGSLVPTDASGDFTFTRGSNLSATRVNEQGFIEKGYENLLLQSNSFDTTWIPRDATITGGQAGYDGTNDAWLLQAVSNGYNRRIYQSVSLSSVFTFSFYAKANTSNYAQAIVFNSTGADPKSYFNLSTGETGTTTDSIDVNMADVGDGWYRCSITGNASVSQIWLLVSDYGYTNLVDAGGSIYIQDAQLNQSLVSYPYVETTTAPEKGGILADLPRVDYSSGRASLLLEPQRSNYLRHSENFYITPSDWRSEGNNGVTITMNDTTSPEGFANAAKLRGGGASNDRLQFNMISFPSASALYSVFIKGASEATTMRLFNTRTADRIDFNVSAQGVVTFDNSSGVSNYGIEDYDNGWYRIWAELSTISGATNYFQIYPDISGTNSIYIYGAQAEQDATYPTSYIPTYGTSQTRLQESGEVTQINNYIVDITGDFTFYVDTTDSLLKGNELFYYFIELYWNVSTRVQCYSTSNGSWYYRPDNEYMGFNDAVGKQIIKYENGVFYHFLNGFKSIQTKTMATSSSLQEIKLLTNSNGKAGYLNLKEMLLFPTALSDEACIELTTL